MKGLEESYGELERLVDAMLTGKAAKPLETGGFPDSLVPFAEKTNLLAETLGKTLEFARELARGNLDPDVPNSRNYLAVPLKEIHSQLSSLSYSMQQLLNGNMVSKLYYPGELYERYNRLMKQEARELESSASGGWSAANSWRYHQVLSAINQLHVMILEVNREGKIVFANPPAREMFGEDRLPCGVPGDEIKGELLRYLSGFEGRAAEGALGNAAADKFSAFHELYDKDAGVWYKITSDSVRLVDGSFGVLHMIDDISEWKRQEERLTITASADPLTGAYTRKVGMRKLRAAVKNRAAERNCVAFVDVDNLKAINDLYGHAEGDHAILAVADVLKNCSRGDDRVIRYGGDEFLVIFENCRYQTAEKVIHRMLERMEEVNRMAGKPYRIGFSVGCAEIQADMADVETVIAAVDERMYFDKRRKKTGAGSEESV